MINKENGFDLNVRWRFPGGREYAFAFVALFVFLIAIYSNSFQGDWVFDDIPNITKNTNVHVDSLNWSDIKNTFYGVEGKKIDRPVAFLTFALNYYYHELNVFGYHLVNFFIHYVAAVFLFLFIYNILKLPILKERYGSSGYAIALLSVFLWATSPVQVSAVTYIVQRMASMAAMFYIMAMYFYLKGRVAQSSQKRVFFWCLCLLSAVLSLGSKENAALLPFSIWLFDLLLIQGASRENVIRNLKVFVPVVIMVVAAGLWYVNIGAIISGSAFENRPFTALERLMTQPRVVVWYITLLLYPIKSRLTLIHDTELFSSLMDPWTTMPAIALILGLLAIAVYLGRRRPLISFAMIFYFLNHAIESSFLPLELIYEHRNYIPSMFFFIPIAIAMVNVLDYFSYKKIIQYIAAAVFTFLIFAQGHVVYDRNAVFKHPLLLWTDNVIKTPTMSRTHNNLGSAYWKLGRYEEAYELFSKAESLDNHPNLRNRGIISHNLGQHYLRVEKDYDRALEYFQESIKAYPGYWPAYHDSAICFIRQGDLVEAGNRLAYALQRWSGDAGIRQSLSFVLLKMGEFEQAIYEARKSLKIDPEQHNALAVLGEAFRLKGSDRMAVFYWEQLYKKHPNDIEANLALIELYSLQHRRSDLSRIIGNLMGLRGWERWGELVDRVAEQEHVAVYIPDKEEIVGIIKNYIDGTLQ